MKPKFKTKVVKEGKVAVLVPDVCFTLKNHETHVLSKAPVFYNPRMEFSRDVAVVALQTYQSIMGREITICEPFTGCGIRGIRYAKEVDGVSVTINDINSDAVKLARINVKKNSVENRVSTIGNADANTFLALYFAPKKRFDAIDIDPFGSPAPYIESAIMALRNGGLIALTATDMAPLCGIYPQACLRKYGGKPLRTEYCHELATRILLNSLGMAAARHEMGIHVLFSHSTDHYIRVYAEVKHGAKQADSTTQMIGYALHCFSCFHHEISMGITNFLKKKCSECGKALAVAGPLWAGKLADKEFCTKMGIELQKKQLKTKKKLTTLVNMVSNEVDAAPLYYVIDRVCDRFNLRVPPTAKITQELENRGYKVTLTHFHPKGIKTDAPALVFREVLSQSKVCESLDLKERSLNF
ncbi:tRNA (guanine(10)-N(2))-dimethyltransferase [Candidatus Bathyarchaeota archaeon]|nr:tRNA (guanine(10)-N(2))-dimethyltransferase [Candidatus Bathyarchaeota archaeon]